MEVKVIELVQDNNEGVGGHAWIQIEDSHGHTLDIRVDSEQLFHHSSKLYVSTSGGRGKEITLYPDEKYDGALTLEPPFH
jgi:hypothetical protein